MRGQCHARRVAAGEGKPIPEEIKRLLCGLVDASTAGGESIDIYAAAGLGKPSLSELTPEFEAKARKLGSPHLAITRCALC